MPKETLVLHTNQQLTFNKQIIAGKDFLSSLDDYWRKYSSSKISTHRLPFYSGWFVYLGYELAAQIETKLSCYTDPNLPVAFATRITTAVIRDHKQSCLYLVSDNEETVNTLLADLENAKPIEETKIEFDKIEEDDPQHYINGIERIKNYILEGDIFQVNLSRGWKAESSYDFPPLSLYRQLRRCNPAPFSALAKYGNQYIISSSPERLVSTKGQVIQTRPIAGTRPRASAHNQDKLLAAELMENIKERAEHIMLIDLERNDLGRVCEAGSIEVDALMVRETYAHVHHIVSNIRGRLRKNTPPGEILRAVFPGGTITGCPKVRCMEIIYELENAARGAYTGSLGYINDNGDMDLNILIRTLISDGKTVHFRAGGGIVADSIPEREVDETRSKAKGLLQALQFQ